MVKELVEMVDDELAGKEEERGGGLQEGGKINWSGLSKNVLYNVLISKERSIWCLF